MILISIIFAFLSVFIISFVVFIIPMAEKRLVTKSLDNLEDFAGNNKVDEIVTQPESVELKNRQSKPFTERIIVPTFIKLSNLARKFTPKGMVESIDKKLIMAGNPRGLTVDSFLAIKAIFSFIAVFILFLIGITNPVVKAKFIVLSSMLIPVAFFIPDYWLIKKVEKRQKEIRLALPDVLDLLTISVEAGLGFDAALTKVIKNNRGALAQEFSKVLSESQIGISRKDALKNLANRSNVPELHSFITSLVQADVLGISISKVLRTQAREMRIKRRQKAEEIAQKAPVKIVFPLILCIFPSLMIVILGPAAIRIYYTLITFFNRQ